MNELNEGMLNDTPAQKTDRLLGVRKKKKKVMRIICHIEIRIKSRIISLKYMLYYLYKYLCGDFD